ncbi:MAG: transposase [Nitrospirae bacterium]|nr:transposase [Nitrospirota bacterium]
MARKPRIEYEGAFYHVITRGNRREHIFRDRNDFLKYLDILSLYKKRYRFRIYSYVLMSNHVHLLIETIKTPLSKIQQGINQSYTMYFNRRHRTTGHLFQGRYKAILCDRDTYLLSLIKYIHKNPVRAKMVTKPDDYKWSSHRCYAGKDKQNDIVDTDPVLRMFSEDKAASRRRYNDFLEDGIDVKKEDVYATVDQRVLGSEEFLGSVMEKYDGDITIEKRGRAYTLAKIARGVENIKGVTIEQMRKQSKFAQISSARKLFILVAASYGYKGKEIAEYIKRDPATISATLKESTIKESIQFEKDMETMLNFTRIQEYPNSKA